MTYAPVYWPEQNKTDRMGLSNFIRVNSMAGIAGQLTGMKFLPDAICMYFFLKISAYLAENPCTTTNGACSCYVAALFLQAADSSFFLAS